MVSFELSDLKGQATDCASEYVCMIKTVVQINIFEQPMIQFFSGFFGEYSLNEQLFV